MVPMPVLVLIRSMVPMTVLVLARSMVPMSVLMLVRSMVPMSVLMLVRSMVPMSVLVLLNAIAIVPRYDLSLRRIPRPYSGPRRHAARRHGRTWSQMWKAFARWLLRSRVSYTGSSMPRRGTAGSCRGKTPR
ncbi:unnamed protein product [Choristocarpus tenellus]